MRERLLRLIEVDVFGVSADRSDHQVVPAVHRRLAHLPGDRNTEMDDIQRRPKERPDDFFLFVQNRV